MDRLEKPRKFLKELRLTDSDYQDNGMINHIADLLDRYHKKQTTNVSVCNYIPDGFRPPCYMNKLIKCENCKFVKWITVNK